MWLDATVGVCLVVPLRIPNVDCPAIASVFSQMPNIHIIDKYTYKCRIVGISTIKSAETKDTIT